MRHRTPSAIHLIEKLGLIEAMDESRDVYESGFWAVSAQTAAELIGGDIYFHTARATPSFFGGRILDYRVQPDGRYAGRIIFRLRPDPEHAGVSAGADGWGLEKKIVWRARTA